VLTEIYAIKQQYLFILFYFDSMFRPTNHHQTNLYKTQNKVQRSANSVFVIWDPLYLFLCPKIS